MYIIAKRRKCLLASQVVTYCVGYWVLRERMDRYAVNPLASLSLCFFL